MCEIWEIGLRVGNSRWRAVRGLTNSDCLETRRPICSCAQRQQSLRKFKSLPCANEALWAALSGINNGMHATTCQARPMHQPKKKGKLLSLRFFGHYSPLNPLIRQSLAEGLVWAYESWEAGRQRLDFPKLQSSEPHKVACLGPM